MLNSPVGFISFFANILILVVGELVHLISREKHVRRKVIITQGKVHELEQSKKGFVVSRTLAAFFPIVLTTFIFITTFKSLTILSHDTDRITALDVAKIGIAKIASSIDFAQNTKPFVVPAKELPPSVSLPYTISSVYNKKSVFIPNLATTATYSTIFTDVNTTLNPQEIGLNKLRSLVMDAVISKANN